MNILEEVLENSDANKKEKCKTCAYCLRTPFNHVTIFYCRKKLSNRTYNGLLKIKANNMACEKYQAETK
jgi:predicted aldo/keto reductase-like oxidoreductase